MKQHIVVQLHQGLPDDLAIPDWISFLTDKSAVKESATPAIDRLMSEFGLAFWVTREYRPAGSDWSSDEIRNRLNRTYRLILQKDYNLPPGLVQRIRLLPAVDDAHELVVAEAPIPQPEFSTQASTARRAADQIYAGYAQAFTKGDPAIRIAVLDTGIDINHPELRGKVVRSSDFVDLHGLDTTNFIGDFRDWDNVADDEVGHGTHVSGIIAGAGAHMDEGVAPGCSIVAVRVLATMRKGDRLCGAGIVDNINPAIKATVDGGVDVINMSLGIKHTGGGLPHADVIRYALSKNVTVIAASGNDGTPARYFPGALPGVIAVGAVDGVGSVTPFTSYGANITVVAPGVNIYSSFAHGTYAVASGTSQASPFVAGSVGLLKSFAKEQGKTLTNEQLIDIFKHTSDRMDSRLRNERAGYGIVNLADAFKYLVHMVG